MKKFPLFLIILLLIFPSALGDISLSPGEKDILLEQAIILGQEAFQKQFGFSDEMMQRFSLSAQLWDGAGSDFTGVKEESLRVWSISFRYAGEMDTFLDEATHDLIYSIHIHAQSGEILSSPWDDAGLFQSKMDHYLSLAADADYCSRRQEAYQLAQEYLMDATGMTREDTAPLAPQLVLLSDTWESPTLPIDYENAWWRVSFSLPGLDDQPALILAVEAESRYTYLDAGNEQDFALAYLGYLEWQEKWGRAQNALLTLADEKGDPLFWDYTEKADFYAKYGMPPDLTGEAANLSYDLPGEKDIAYEDALSAARNGLIQHLKVEEAELDSLKISAIFTAQFWHPSGNRAWIIHFYSPDSTSQSPRNLYTAFILASTGQPLTLMRIQETGIADLDYWSAMDE